MHLLLHADCFETLQVFRLRSVDVHIVWAISSDHICHFFTKLTVIFVAKMNKYIVIFAAKINRYLVWCVCISSYSFILIPLKLYRCLAHELKMCILFGYNPHFFAKMNLGGPSFSTRMGGGGDDGVLMRIPIETTSNCDFQCVVRTCITDLFLEFSS